MTGDLEPTPLSGSNVWPTRPVPPARSVMAGGQSWSSPSSPTQTASDSRQSWPSRPATTINYCGPAGLRPGYPSPHQRARSASAPGASSTAHYSLIWLSLMLVALSLLLLSFVVWDRPVTDQQGADLPVLSHQESR